METEWKVEGNEIKLGRFPAAAVAQIYDGSWRWHSNLRHSSSRKRYATRCEALTAAARALGKGATAAVKCSAEV